MRRIYQFRDILAIGKEVYVGIDVHKESFHVTAIAGGEEVFNGGMPSRYEVLGKLLNRLRDCCVKVAYEAGPSGFWLYDRLTADGIDTIVVPPSLIPVESGNRVKTDKRDSRKLARLLEGGLLKRVYVLSDQERADRELLRTRRQLVTNRADVAKQVRVVLVDLFIDLSGIDSRIDEMRGNQVGSIIRVREAEGAGVCHYRDIKRQRNITSKPASHEHDQIVYQLPCRTGPGGDHVHISESVVALFHLSSYGKII